MQLRKGWIFADAVVALGLLGICGGVLAVAANRNAMEMGRLNNMRSASRLAEAALIARQSDSAGPEGNVSVKDLGASDLPGMNWVEATAKVGDAGHMESAKIVGLAPGERGAK